MCTRWVSRRLQRTAGHIARCPRITHFVPHILSYENEKNSREQAVVVQKNLSHEAGGQLRLSGGAEFESVCAEGTRAGRVLVRTLCKHGGGKHHQSM